MQVDCCLQYCDWWGMLWAMFDEFFMAALTNGDVSLTNATSAPTKRPHWPCCGAHKCNFRTHKEGSLPLL